MKYTHTRLTSSQKGYIFNNHATESVEDMARKIGVSGNMVRRFMNSFSLKTKSEIGSNKTD